MNFYFWIAYYSDGRLRMFNTKFEPKPMNRLGKGKLIKLEMIKRTVG